MSAAATAAGYLYASGRLRSKNKEADEHSDKPAKRREAAREAPEIKVAILHREEKPRKEPKIQYRTRRWKPEPE